LPYFPLPFFSVAVFSVALFTVAVISVNRLNCALAHHYYLPTGSCNVDDTIDDCSLGIVAKLLIDDCSPVEWWTEIFRRYR